MCGKTQRAQSMRDRYVWETMLLRLGWELGYLKVFVPEQREAAGGCPSLNPSTQNTPV